MKQDLISIIVPAYNAEKTIRVCLTSILNQSCHNLEVIVINDGSSDATLQICQEFEDSRLRVCSQPKQGVAAARNKGIREAKGEYLLFADADDRLHSKIVENVLNNIGKDTDFLLFHTYKTTGNNTVLQRSFPKDIVCVTKEPLKHFFSQDYAYGVLWGKLIRKRLIQENCLEMDPELSVGEDRDFLYQLLSCCRQVQFMESDYGGYYYQVNSSSVSRRFSKELIASYLCLCKKMESRYVDRIREPEYRIWLIGILRKLIINGIFHPDNQASYWSKRRALKMLLEDSVFREAVNNADGRVCHGASERIFCYLLQKRLYLAMFLISIMRYRQITAKKSDTFGEG